MHLTQAGRLPADVESPAGFPGVLPQHLHELHALSVPIGHGQRGRAHPEEDIRRFPDGLDDGGGRGLPTVCQRDISRPQRKVDATCAGMLGRDGQGDTLSLDQVHTAVPAILGALGARALDVTAVAAQQAPGGGKRGDRVGVQHLRHHGLHPWTTGSSALRHRRVGHRLVQEREVSRSFPERLLPAAR
jgi:hypothetical protein